MKAAIVDAPGNTPRYSDIAEPQLMPGWSRIRVSAAAMSQIVKGLAAGGHYGSSSEFPIVAGLDGVGRLDDGQRVYFAVPQPRSGSMAEIAVAPASLYVPIPDDIDDVTAAAIANPGQSSWGAYTERAKLQPGETVLVNGATSTSGRLAVQIAKHLGAAKVIATGRNAEALREVEALGADVVIQLADDAEGLDRQLLQPFAEGIGVVLDYLWGRSAERILTAAAKVGTDTPIRYVQIGSVSGSDIQLPAAVLRSSAVELMGSGRGSISLPRFMDITARLMEAAMPAGLRIATTAVPLSEVERAWPLDDGKRRTVFTLPGTGSS